MNNIRTYLCKKIIDRDTDYLTSNILILNSNIFYIVRILCLNKDIESIKYIQTIITIPFELIDALFNFMYQTDIENNNKFLTLLFELYKEKIVLESKFLTACTNNNFLQIQFLIDKVNSDITQKGFIIGCHNNSNDVITILCNIDLTITNELVNTLFIRESFEIIIIILKSKSNIKLLYNTNDKNHMYKLLELLKYESDESNIILLILQIIDEYQFEQNWNLIDIIIDDLIPQYANEEIIEHINKSNFRTFVRRIFINICKLNNLCACKLLYSHPDIVGCGKKDGIIEAIKSESSDILDFMLCKKNDIGSYTYLEHCFFELCTKYTVKEIDFFWIKISHLGRKNEIFLSHLCSMFGISWQNNKIPMMKYLYEKYKNISGREIDLRGMFIKSCESGNIDIIEFMIDKVDCRTIQKSIKIAGENNQEDLKKILTELL